MAPSCAPAKKGMAAPVAAMDSRLNHRTVVWVPSVLPTCRIVMVTIPAPKAARLARSRPSGGRSPAFGPHHDQHSDESEDDRSPAVAPDRFAQDQGRQSDREERRGEADRRRLRQRKQGERAEAEDQGRQPRRSPPGMGQRPPGPPGREIAAGGDPQQQRREPEGEAVESHLDDMDPRLVPKLHQHRHEGEAGGGGDSKADPEEPVLLGAVGGHGLGVRLPAPEGTALFPRRCRLRLRWEK